MLSIKPKTAPDLEQTLADRRADLDKARADYRECRLCFEDAKDLLAGSETPENVAAHRLALEDIQAAAEAVNVATSNVKAAELALDLAQTMPLRQTTARRPEAAADAVVKALPALRLALAQMIEALDNASFAEIAGASQAGTLFASWVHRCNEAVTGGDPERFVEELRSYASEILAGSKPATLQPTLAEQRAGLRKAG